MKMRNLVVAGMLLGAMCVMGSMSVWAEEAQELTPGVTVTEDAESPTGYTAQFVYEDGEAQKVTLSGAFAFYNDEKEIIRHST